MCEEFIRRIYNLGYIRDYPINGTKAEKLASELVKELGKTMSIFRITCEEDIDYVLAMQASNKSSPKGIRYIRISSNLIAVDRLKQANEDILWPKAAAMHCNFTFIDDDEKIMIADAIYNNQEITRITPSRIVQCAQELIDNGEVKKEKVNYIK